MSFDAARDASEKQQQIMNLIMHYYVTWFKYVVYRILAAVCFATRSDQIGFGVIRIWTGIHEFYKKPLQRSI